MKNTFQFSRLGVAMLLTNAVVLGGCLVLLALGRMNGPLVLLTIGSLGMLTGKLGKAWQKAPP
jgi:hypothetical protein